MKLDSLSRIGAQLHALFSRVTTSGRYIPEIDGLRFVAVFHVIIIHIGGWLLEKSNVAFANQGNGALFLPLLRRSDLGVLLFFVLSGFILGLPFAQQYLRNGKKIDLRSYYVRRITRIEPPYLINLLVVSVALLLFRTYDLNQLLPHLLASGFYAHNIVYHSASTVNYVTWSLEYEAQFYLLAPFLARCLYSIRSTPLRYAFPWLVLLLMAPLQPFLARNCPWLIISLVQYFLLGMGLADIYTTRWHGQPQKGVLWDLIGASAAVLLFGMSYLPANFYRNYFATPLLLALIFSAAFKGSGFRSFLRLPFVTVVGGMCYTIYLYHSQIMSAVIPMTRSWIPQVTNLFPVALLLELVILLPIILIVCAGLFLLTEKPFMNPNWPGDLKNFLLTTFQSVASRDVNKELNKVL